MYWVLLFNDSKFYLAQVFLSLFFVYFYACLYLFLFLSFVLGALFSFSLCLLVFLFLSFFLWYLSCIKGSENSMLLNQFNVINFFSLCCAINFFFHFHFSLFFYLFHFSLPIQIGEKRDKTNWAQLKNKKTELLPILIQ